LAAGPDRRARARVLSSVFLLVALAACGPHSALDPAGPDAHRIAGLWWLIFWLGAAVYVVTMGLVAFAVIRARRRDATGARSPHRALIWGGGVVVPAVILTVLMGFTIDTARFVGRPPDGPLRVEVIGHQFWWEVNYPGLGIHDANEINIPTGQPVEIVLTSEDVIHSFWVPRLTGKLDQIPGKVHSLRLEAEDPGVYRGQCAEFCGIQHANMIFFVIAHEADDFDAWVADSLVPPDPVTAQQLRGQETFMDAGCAECHAIAGTEAEARIGPDLTWFARRRTIGSGTVPNTRGNLGGWVLNPQDLKPGNLMPPTKLSPDELHALLDYLESLR
jgi:cytochrome c oxidase subunit II